MAVFDKISGVPEAPHFTCGCSECEIITNKKLGAVELSMFPNLNVWVQSNLIRKHFMNIFQLE